MPTRADSLPLALASILPQVDVLYLYLDQFDDVPDIARSNSRIIPVLHGQYPGLHSNGKYVGLILEKAGCYYVACDDDILYPPNYVIEMCDTIERFRKAREAVVAGVHASILKRPFRSYKEERVLCSFRRSLHRTLDVDILGAGTIIFHTSDLSFDPRDWSHVNVDDLMLAIEAEKKNVKRVAIKRPDNFLTPIAQNQPDSLYRRLASDESLHNELAEELISVQAAKGSHSRSRHRGG